MSDDFGDRTEQHNPQRRNKDQLKALRLVKMGFEPEDVYSDEDLSEEPWKQGDPDWAPEVKVLWAAVAHDPMSMLMTPMGWATLRMKCAAWSREFKEKYVGIDPMGNLLYAEAPVPAGVLSDMTRTMAGFGADEASRRAMKVLLDHSERQQSVADKEDRKLTIVRPARKAIAG